MDGYHNSYVNLFLKEILRSEKKIKKRLLLALLGGELSNGCQMGRRATLEPGPMCLSLQTGKPRSIYLNSKRCVMRITVKSLKTKGGNKGVVVARICRWWWCQIRDDLAHSKKSLWLLPLIHVLRREGGCSDRNGSKRRTSGGCAQIVDLSDV